MHRFGPLRGDGSGAWMIQGTGSGVGKSLIVAGLCRLLARRGVRVAPFKAQNMALNAAVTPDGREIGRAQAFQAEAAGIAPHVDMNPILLKPTGDAESQVVVLGEVVDRLSAQQYYRGFADRLAIVRDAYDRLAARFDCVILEGAGSPAEINLRDRDLVNMRMAAHARAPVWIVADIDRGGVFASIKGTFDLLTDDERAMVDGFVINRFRGDVTLLMPGIEMLRAHVPRSVHAVLPWLHDLDVDEEDAPGVAPVRAAADELDVAVLRLRRIANFTDFRPLTREPGVRLRYVEDVRSLGDPDLLILPGTKSTTADLAWLTASGLAERVAARIARGGATFGVCGGYQMLGVEIADAAGVDGPCGVAQGFGALPIVTTMAATKTTVPFVGSTVATAIAPGGVSVVGYEIHMGRTELVGANATDVTPLFAGASATLGLVRNDGVVAGAYVHGCFDGDAFRGAILDWARRRRGLPERGSSLDYAAHRAAQLDRLADWLEANVAALRPLASRG